MPEFLHLFPPTEARALFMRHVPDRKPVPETIDTIHALGRVTAEDIRAPHPLPEFPRSTVDGYAVRARDTYGASDSLPAYLRVIGEVPMGAPSSFALKNGECAIVHTGGMLPEGCDAVIMLENTQAIDRRERKEKGGFPAKDSAVDEIEILRSIAEGENSIRVGEDVAERQVVIPTGVRIRPAEIGGLMALGITQLRVASKFRVGIISSGDEVLPPEQRPGPGQVRDINTYSLAALVTQIGSDPVLYGIVPDRLEAMKTTVARALTECDLVLVTAGSSASARDTTAEAIAALGAPGVLVHGINVRPGKPTILAVCDGKPVIGLPGNPVSALVIAGLFVIPIIERMLGLKARSVQPSVRARLTINIPSQAGREDWVAVKLHPSLAAPSRRTPLELPEGEGGWLAEPIFTKSNLIFSLVAADGLVRVPADATGVSAGEVVEVFL